MSLARSRRPGKPRGDESDFKRNRAGCYRTLRFSEVSRSLAGQIVFFKRAFVPAFEDAYASISRYAWPMLLQTRQL
jgi:hypothetical protein